jgi:ketosteroid isomerase-like protein
MPATDSDHSQQVIVEVADRLFAAIERSDEATLTELFDDDIAVWRVGARRDNDKERALKVLRWFISVTTQRRYEILDRQLFHGAVSGFVQQHILHATGHDGALIAMRVCIVIKVGVNALISRIDEYFDPADLAPLMS